MASPMRSSCGRCECRLNVRTPFINGVRSVGDGVELDVECRNTGRRLCEVDGRIVSGHEFVVVVVEAGEHTDVRRSPRERLASGAAARLSRLLFGLPLPLVRLEHGQTRRTAAVRRFGASDVRRRSL